MGEHKYYPIVSMLTAIPSDMKSTLWDMKIDWEKISDFEFFIFLVRSMPVEATSIFFGDIDFTKFDVKVDRQSGLIQMRQNDLIIDEYVHAKIDKFLCMLHDIKHKPEVAMNEFTKQYLIEEDRENIEMAKRRKESKSVLTPLILFLANSREFKYNANEILDMGIFSFMENLKQVLHNISVYALFTGMYSGNIDTSKLKPSSLDFIRKLN